MNPSISYGSILCLTIRDVKMDYEDLTLSISNNILPPLNGDYDGKLKTYSHMIILFPNLIN